MRRPGGVRRPPSSLEPALGNPGKGAISHEPVPPAGEDLLTPPDFLDERAVDEWNRIAPLLAQLTEVGKACLNVHLICPRAIESQPRFGLLCTSRPHLPPP